MPLPNIPVPQYPDVPFAPGVPPVLRQAGALQAQILNPIIPLLSDVALIAQFLKGPQWGIFDQNGQPVVVGDSVVAVDFRNEYRISDYPTEDGGFASYNKVASPYNVKLVFTQGGTDSDRANFLRTVASIVASTALFNAVTPEITYTNANATHYDYRRTARNGATLLMVDVWLEEVRLTAAPIFSNTQAPSGAAVVNDGNVQATPLRPPPGSTMDSNFPPPT